MPDRLAELLQKAKESKLTAVEREELITALNAPILSRPFEGFRSNRPMQSTDIPSRVGAVDWFTHCGEPVTLDLTMPIDPVRSWPEAAVELRAWQNVEIKAGNQLSIWLDNNHCDEYHKWDDVTMVHKREVVDPLTEQKLISFQQEHQLSSEVVHCVQWDILGALMENVYIGLGHQCFFFLELLQVYEAGHFPCGWVGTWPKGMLRVY